VRVETIGDATLLLGDCREILPTIGAVDAVVTDPPYGIRAARGSHSNLRMADEDWDDVPADLSHLPKVPSIIWGGNYFLLPPSRCFLFWDKHPMPPSYAAGELAWTSLDRNAAKWCGKVGDEVGVRDRSHPTQKPVALMEWCLGFVPNARIILDPFMGSGTTGVACARLGRRFVGIEIEERYFSIACRRIEAAQRQKDLFVHAPVAEDPAEARLVDLFAEPEA
jgi:site-specific DNA-methyltransferase (adenine-specific)/modification methylase